MNSCSLFYLQWEFTEHDKDNNGLLVDKEITTLLAVMQYEPCGYGFIMSCAMVDGIQGITLEEWYICFNVAGEYGRTTRSTMISIQLLSILV